MAIEVGDLYLAITAPAQPAEASLSRLDKAALRVADTVTLTEKRLAAQMVVTQKLAAAQTQAAERERRARADAITQLVRQNSLESLIEKERGQRAASAVAAIAAASRSVLGPIASNAPVQSVAAARAEYEARVEAAAEAARMAADRKRVATFEAGRLSKDAALAEAYAPQIVAAEKIVVAEKAIATAATAVVPALKAQTVESIRMLAAREKVAAAVEAERVAYRALNSAGSGIGAGDAAKLEKSFESAFAKRATAERALATLQVQEQTKAIAIVEREAMASARMQQRFFAEGLRATGLNPTGFNSRGGGGIGGMVALLAGAAVIAGIRDVIKAANDARDAQNRLRGSAIDTGRSFASVVLEADALRKRYLLTRDDASTLELALGKLEQTSKRVGSSQEVAAAAMTTLQARGLKGADAVKAITEAVNGNDEAIRELTGLKADQLYDAYAKSAGKAGNKLNDMGKANAIVNGILVEGARRAKDAKDAIDPLVRKQDELNQKFADAKVALGKSLDPVKEWFADFVIGAASAYDAWDKLTMRLQGSLSAKRLLPNLQAFFDEMERRAFAGEPGARTSPSPRAFIGPRQFIGPMVPRGFDPNAPHTPGANEFKPDPVDKRTTEEYLATLKELVDEQRASAKEIQHGIDIYMVERKVLDEGTASMKRRAEAARNLKTLRAIGIEMPIGDLAPGLIRHDETKRDVAGQVSELERLHKENALTIADLTTGADLLAKETAAANASNLAWAEREEHMKNVDRLSKALFIATPVNMTKLENTIPTDDDIQGTVDSYWKDFYAAYVSRGDNAKALFSAYNKKFSETFAANTKESMVNALNEQFAMFTINVAGSVLDSIAAGFEKGGQSFKEMLLGSLGGILKAMGKQLILTGGALKGLLPFLSNPFTSGPAMVTAGALIFGAGVALSHIAGGNGNASNAALGGGLGSLATGAASAPQIYTFGQRPASTGGMQASEAPRPIVNNFTVIGANDPGAQRQIITLIDNGYRRGIGSGSGGHA